MAVTTPEYTTESAPVAAPAAVQPPRAQRAWLIPAIIGLIAGFVLGAGAVATAFTLSKSGNDPEQQQILSACHDAVKDRLKAPATAQFSKEEITNEKTSVRGSVDSQNGFGALIRGSFTCTMSNSSGKWQATDVQLAGA